jgi:hypothetical protein
VQDELQIRFFEIVEEEGKEHKCVLLDIRKPA